MEFNHLVIEQKEHLALIIINRPQSLNALNKEVITELSECLKSLEAKPEVRCILLKGAGDKAFVAGADIKEFVSFSQSEGKTLSQEGHDKLFNLVENLSKPVIALINGYALGGGLELAMACHIRIAADNAQLGLPEVSLGLIPGYGGTQRLTQLIGKGRALEMITSANMIDGKQAYVYGLVNSVVNANNLLVEGFKLGMKIATNSPNAIASAIKAVNACTDDSKDGYQVEIDAFGDCFGTDDFKEGTDAFLNKRKPKF